MSARTDRFVSFVHFSLVIPYYVVVWCMTTRYHVHMITLTLSDLRVMTRLAFVLKMAMLTQIKVQLVQPVYACVSSGHSYSGGLETGIIQKLSARFV